MMNGNTGMCRVLALVLAGGLVLVAGPGGAGPKPRPEPAGEKAEPKATGHEQASALDRKAMAELALEHTRARDALLAAESRLGLLMEKAFGARLQVRYDGELDRPFRLARVELSLDGALAYRREFESAPGVQALTLLDAYLPPGRHVLGLRVFAHGPDDPRDDPGGYFAGCGMTVHLRDGSDTLAVFEAEQEGDTPGRAALREQEPEGSWEVNITGWYQTEAR